MEVRWRACWDGGLMAVLSCLPRVLVGVWELGISTLQGGKGYSSLCLTEIKFRATGYPSRTENQSV